MHSCLDASGTEKLYWFGGPQQTAVWWTREVDAARIAAYPLSVEREKLGKDKSAAAAAQQKADADRDQINAGKAECAARKSS